MRSLEELTENAEKLFKELETRIKALDIETGTRLRALEFASKLYQNGDGMNGVATGDQDSFFLFVGKIENYIAKGNSNG